MIGYLISAKDAHDRCCWISESGERCDEKPEMAGEGPDGRLSTCAKHHHESRKAKLAPDEELEEATETIAESDIIKDEE